MTFAFVVNMLQFLILYIGAMYSHVNPMEEVDLIKNWMISGLFVRVMDGGAMYKSQPY